MAQEDYSNDNVAKMETEDIYVLNFPIGRKLWFIKDQICEWGDGNQHPLTMSKCEYPQQFTCNSGDCIDMINRCDDENQCTDSSDEKVCELVDIPYSYNAEKAPSSLAKGYPLDIDTKIDIENIDSIDTVNMVFSLTMKLNFQWYDKVLMFSNLIPESNNFIPHHKRDLIWYPTRDIVHENAIIGETKYNYDNYDMTVYAFNAEKPDVRNSIENRLFNGSKNPLNLRMRMKATYSCTFDVRKFPFDVQQCCLIMKINQHRYDKIRFISNGNIGYSGERIIDQFSIGKIHSEATYSNASTEFKVIIPMSRIAINQFLNTFFPTVILWLFGYSTLFIDPNQNGFDNRFMGSGTALLVVATLINAVKSDLPKTAYTKFIDIWFLWHVISIFSTIVYHIALDRLRKKLENQNKNADEVFEYEEDGENALDTPNTRMINNINKCLIVLFPTLNGIFYIVYFYLKIM